MKQALPTVLLERDAFYQQVEMTGVARDDDVEMPRFAKNALETLYAGDAGSRLALIRIRPGKEDLQFVGKLVDALHQHAAAKMREADVLYSIRILVADAGFAAAAVGIRASKTSDRLNGAFVEDASNELSIEVLRHIIVQRDEKQILSHASAFESVGSGWDAYEARPSMNIKNI